MAKAYIGTSGWSYKDWGKRFYPADLPNREQLPFLAKHFDTVELNASFYHLPLAKTFANWREITPPHFRFTAKLSRYVTHIKRLHDVKDSWELFLERAAPMGDKLAVILIQLPPSFNATPESRADITEFLSYAAKSGHRLAFEFRHQTDFETGMLEILTQHQAALVFAESSRFPHSPLDFAPADFVYYRFHGPQKLYASKYGEEALRPWAQSMQKYLKSGKDVFAYFDNDHHGYALEDAKTLQSMIKDS